MARVRRDTSIESRDARARLQPRHAPYWRTIHKGLALGYRKGPEGGTWIVRYLDTASGTYKAARIATADDYQDADGLGVLDFRAAQLKAMERASDAERQERVVHLGPYTVSDALDDYLEWVRAHRKGIRDTETAINTRIRPKLGNIEVRNLTAKRIRRWMQDYVQAPRRVRGKEIQVDLSDPETLRKRRATVNRVLTILKAALNFAYHEGRVPSADEWRKVKPFSRTDSPKIRYLTEYECIRLINASDSDFRLLVQAALLTGCRYGELIRLEVGDYHADVGRIHVRDSKGGKPRFVPLTDEGWRFFSRIVAGQPANALVFDHESPDWKVVDGRTVRQTVRIPWGESHQSRPMKAACDAAGIDPPVTFHVLRHTYASLLAKAGVPLQVIARALGHADIRMTERYYAHLSPDHIADQVRAHLPNFGLQSGNVQSIR